MKKEKNVAGIRKFPEGLRSGAEAVATRRTIACQIEMEMRKVKDQVGIDFEMRTSRSALNRLLDPTNVSVTLQILERAASSLGKNLKIQLV